MIMKFCPGPSIKSSDVCRAKRTLNTYLMVTIFISTNAELVFNFQCEHLFTWVV